MTVTKHPMLSSSGQAWLLALADPLGARPLPSSPLGVLALAQLFDAAALHGVLPAVARNLRAATGREDFRTLADGKEVAAFLREKLAESERLLSGQREIHEVLVGESAKLGRALTAANIRFAMVKGEVFARRLYPSTIDRPFGDIDVLVPAEDFDQAGSVLKALGYRHTHSVRSGAAGARLDKWLLEGE